MRKQIGKICQGFKDKGIEVAKERRAEWVVGVKDEGGEDGRDGMLITISEAFMSFGHGRQKNMVRFSRLYFPSFFTIPSPPFIHN